MIAFDYIAIGAGSAGAAARRVAVRPGQRRALIR